MAVLKWGFCGAGIMAREFGLALSALPEDTRDKHRVVAVAARSLERAVEFAAKFNIPKAVGSYEELASDAEVDVVYVNTINSAHYKCALMMIKGKKHVLCEKTMTLSGKQTAALIRAAEENGVFLMEAVWTRFFPAIIKLRELLSSRAIGEVRYVRCDFSFKPNTDGWNVERLYNPALGGGALCDVGVYPLQLVSLAFGGIKPETVQTVGKLMETGADEYAALNLKYPNGTAQISVGIGFEGGREATIVGTKGMIKIPYPCWSPVKLITPEGELSFPELPEEINGEKFNLYHSWGLMYEAEEVRRCIEGGQRESEGMPLAETQLFADILDQALSTLGVQYDITV